MNVIRVPKPDANAFQKSRRISDLLLSQIQHFQHVVHKQAIPIDAATAQDIHTEGGAARYIAAVTTAIHSRASAPAGEPAVLQMDRTRLRKQPTRRAEALPGISIAASIEETRPRSALLAESESETSTNQKRAKKTKGKSKPRGKKS